jgi:hypothetical protein
MRSEAILDPSQYWENGDYHHDVHAHDEHVVLGDVKHSATPSTAKVCRAWDRDFQCPYHDLSW